MTFAMREMIGISKRRGFWLRYFLGRVLLLFALAQLSCATADASICIIEPVYVTRASGFVVDSHEKGIPGALVIISTDAGVVARTKTDEGGYFHVKVPRGEYGMQVQAAGYMDGSADLRVGLGLRAILRRGALFLPLTTALGYCPMQPTTNRRALKAETQYWRTVFEPQVKHH